uniref:Uncharacterized protein n=1 Tax=Anguilla anguilla TaxID=7936 RepID=A0A0E9RUR1_ANGAN
MPAGTAPSTGLDLRHPFGSDRSRDWSAQRMLE